MERVARRSKPYPSYQLSEDYYRAGQLIWLEADVLIRSRTGNRKSLDDFARAFFGIDDGKWEHPNHYRFQDVVQSMLLSRSACSGCARVDCRIICAR